MIRLQEGGLVKRRKREFAPLITSNSYICLLSLPPQADVLYISVDYENRTCLNNKNMSGILLVLTVRATRPDSECLSVLFSAVVLTEYENYYVMQTEGLFNCTDQLCLLYCI
jgi:hypothetical protein